MEMTSFEIPRREAMFMLAQRAPKPKMEIHLLNGSWVTFCKMDREHADNVTRAVGIATCKKCLANYKRSAS